MKVRQGHANATVLHLRRRPLDAQAYLHQPAQDSDYQILLTQPTVVYDDELRRVALAYLLLEDDEDLAPLRAALRRVKIRPHRRTGGLVTRSEIFGYRPRHALHQDYCSAAILAAQQPDVHACLVSYAPLVEREYARVNPHLYARHKHIIEADSSLLRVLPEWRLEGGVFTSGIVNSANRLAYHRDTDNLPGVWSGMLGLRRNMLGGYLVIPAYGVAVAVADSSLTLFDSQSMIHGVTPLVPVVPGDPESERFTVVYYSLRQMCHCLPFPEEVARIQQKRTVRERKPR